MSQSTVSTSTSSPTLSDFKDCVTGDTGGPLASVKSNIGTARDDDVDGAPWQSDRSQGAALDDDFKSGDAHMEVEEVCPP